MATANDDEVPCEKCDGQAKYVGLETLPGGKRKAKRFRVAYTCACGHYFSAIYTKPRITKAVKVAS